MWALLLVPAGCRATPPVRTPSTPVPANFSVGDENTLWPLRAGNVWVYEVEGTLGERDFQYEARMTVSQSQQTGGVTQATVETYRRERGEDELQAKNEYRVDGDGISQLSQSGKAFSPAKPIVNFPYRGGQTVDLALTGPVGRSDVVTAQKMTVLTRGLEIADALGHRWESIAIESTIEYEDGGDKLTATSVGYWAPRVGLVRLVNETRAEGRLLSREVWSLKRQTITNP